MLATLVENPFDDDQWIFEIKWDGVRALCSIERDKQVTLRSRTGKDLLGQFPELAALGRAFTGLPVVVDGEIVSLDNNGKSSFQRLQARLNRARPSEELQADIPVTFVVFDLLYAAGKDFRARPLAERKRELARRLRSNARFVMYSKDVVAAGKRLFRFAMKNSLEGIVGKRLDSPYRESRSRDWVKIKTQLRKECVIGGWTQPRGSREQFGALLVGLYAGTELRYVGHVGTGFSHKRLVEVMGLLAPLETKGSPFVKTPRANSPVHWVRPRIVAEVKFAEWTSDGIMRAPVFIGLRDDKDPKSCVRERPTPAAKVR